MKKTTITLMSVLAGLTMAAAPAAAQAATTPGDIATVPGPGGTRISGPAIRRADGTLIGIRYSPSRQSTTTPGIVRR